MIGGLTGAFANLTRGPKLPSVGGGRALVTGASSGIGWACAEALVEAGFEVVPQLPKNGVQCVAPMTYVVVFTAPNA